MSLIATIDRFEGDQAVLRLEDSQELVILRSLLPVGLHEGAQVTIQFTTNPSGEADSEATARKILTDILQGR